MPVVVYSCLVIGYNIVLEFPARAIRQGKEIKNLKIGKKKSSLFTHDISVFTYEYRITLQYKDK
jgi:hypothetical protein